MQLAGSLHLLLLLLLVLLLRTRTWAERMRHKMVKKDLVKLLQRPLYRLLVELHRDMLTLAHSGVSYCGIHCMLANHQLLLDGSER